MCLVTLLSSKTTSVASYTTDLLVPLREGRDIYVVEGAFKGTLRGGGRGD